jgi:uncharacterized protein (TIGR02646 family)
MQYLTKNPNSQAIALKYTNKSDRLKIRGILLRTEQKGFCAYTERFVKNTDSAHIEHFFPKKEYPDKIDDYYNWYVVMAWINENRPKKLTTKNGKTFLPIVMPHSEDFSKRITYENGQFVPIDKKDKEVDNLIKFLSLNHFMLCKDRNAHVDYIRTLKSFFSKEEEFNEVLKSDKENLSFATALKHELGIDVSKLLE